MARKFKVGQLVRWRRGTFPQFVFRVEQLKRRKRIRVSVFEGSDDEWKAFGPGYDVLGESIFEAVPMSSPEDSCIN